MKKTNLLSFILLTCALAGLSSVSAAIVLTPVEGKINGRVQYKAIPGTGDGSLNFVDMPLPTNEVRVGATEKSGVGLGYLIAFQTNEEAREALLLGEPVRLEMKVLNKSLGGTTSNVKISFLYAGGNPMTQYVQYQAWNPGWDLMELALLPRNAEPGLYQAEATEAIKEARNFPTAENNLIWFALYVDDSELLAENAGKHIIFSGAGQDRPKLIIGE
jgi:hypothetical protein